MYKLLLVSEDPEVLKAFESIDDWEKLGFRTPKVLSNTEEAIAYLQKHHMDGICFSLSSEASSALGKYLTEHRPLMPIMLAGHTREEVLENVRELYRLLSWLYSDNSDERYSIEENMRRTRHAYFRTIISGHSQSRIDIRKKLSLVRSRMDPDRNCLLIRFALPENNGYLTGHWHYGPERLENALRNIFGAELEGLRLLESVVEDNTIYLLACPMRGTPTMDPEYARTIVRNHVDATISHVYEYLGLELRVDGVIQLPNVMALADPGVLPELPTHQPKAEEGLEWAF